jgi:hypothetical protein
MSEGFGNQVLRIYGHNREELTGIKNIIYIHMIIYIRFYYAAYSGRIRWVGHTPRMGT